MANPSSKPGKVPSKANQFPLVEKFSYGYRNREDITTLPPGILVEGSQNVLTNTFQRVGIRQGYSLDGQRTSNYSPILSAFDWEMHTGAEQHLRAGYDASTSNGKLQFRYVAAEGDNWNGNTFTEGQVYWIDLMTGLSSVRFNFCDFWDFNDELKSLLLFVNGDSDIKMWSGGIATVLFVSPTTITKTGTETWAETGFLNTGTFTQQVTINGTVYTYTGGADTTTLTGVSPSPAGTPDQAVVVQTVVTTPNASMTGIPATLQNFLIQNLNNQIYVAGEENQSVYVSKVNDYKDYSFSSPRLVGEGAIMTLDGVPTALISQQTQMYIGANKDQWYQTQFTLSSDNEGEALQVLRLKTTAKQGTQSQALTTKIKNNICFVSFEPIVNSLGTAADYLNDPQVSDLSFSIVNDMNSYDFTDGSIFYFKQFVYMAVPQEGLIRVYNMTDQGSTDDKGNVVRNHYWEAPQTIPISLFSIIDGELYGHSYQSSNTFKLFSGYNDDGHTMNAVAAFSFENSGIRTALKNSNAIFIEGYISSNTKLSVQIQRDLGGASSTMTRVIDGSDTRIVPPPVDAVSLGKTSLGKHPLGGSLEINSSASTPPKFRVFKTYNRVPYFEEQKRFFSSGIDQRWELICFGTNAVPATEEPTFISE